MKLTKGLNIKNLVYFSLVFMIGLMGACSDDENTPDEKTDCSDSIIIDKELYTNTQTNNYTITNAQITDNCLAIEIESNGCDGATWEAKLYDSGEVAESYPVQRFIRLLLINDDECDSVFTQLYHFDLTPIKNDLQSAILNIEGWDNSLLFE